MKLFYFLCILGLFPILIHSLRLAQISYWKSRLQLNKHNIIHDRLYTSVNGFLLSQKERATNDAIEYTYGEIDFISFIALLSLVKPTQNTIFYDLGSGVGKAVIACAMVFQVKKSCGIELFHALHTPAVLQQRKLAKLAPYTEKAKTIHFIHGDFLATDISDATLIFINATSFFGESWQRINAYITQASQCQIVITTSKPLSSPAFVLDKTTKVMMSWGVVRAYIHKRK